MTQDSPYTFGDSDLAARRLSALAAVYRDSSERFLRRACLEAPARAIDLGCGPGHSTLLVHETSAAKHTVGVDYSEAYLARARASAPANVSYVQHDLRAGPVPIARGELVFERFLLTHLAEPAQRLREFALLLEPGGVLVVQETSGLESEDPTLSRYYEWVGAFQAHYRQTLYIGLELPRLAEQAELSTFDFETHEMQVPGAVMAELHALNLRTWSRDPAAVALFGSAALSELSRALDEIARGARSCATVRASTGQLAARV
ncbi:MAG TPA: methyltransferase domain-containing protein [Polyangiaceae bacterium]|jgi:ubiquinone/menaquinone biosynthesis C-methylase UbiE|nr:methyltransferase domain-containing protein [Polyangiaceae bacterium]